MTCTFMTGSTPRLRPHRHRGASEPFNPGFDLRLIRRRWREPLTSALVFPRRFEAAEPRQQQQQAGRYRNWNPPLLGNLPDGFLRIFPQQLDSVKVRRSVSV